MAIDKAGESFERIAEHFYKRQYQTSKGEWRTKYVALLTDWTGKRRKFPLGSDLKTAREQLKILEARNVKHEDLDKEKQHEKAIKLEVEQLTVAAICRSFWKPKRRCHRMAFGKFARVISNAY